MMKFYYTVLVLFFSVLIISTIYILYYNEDLFKTKYIKLRKNICPDKWSYEKNSSGNYCSPNEHSVNTGDFDLSWDISVNLDNSDCTKYNWAKEYSVLWSGYSGLNERDFCADDYKKSHIYNNRLVRLFENKNSTNLYNEQIEDYSPSLIYNPYFLSYFLYFFCWIGLPLFVISIIIINNERILWGLQALLGFFRQKKQPLLDFVSPIIQPLFTTAGGKMFVILLVVALICLLWIFV